MAATEYVDGGEWNHGVGGGQVWSNYLHHQTNHYTTAVGKTKNSSNCALPGSWARVSVEKAMWNNQAYYHFC